MGVFLPIDTYRHMMLELKYLREVAENFTGYQHGFHPKLKEMEWEKK